MILDITVQYLVEVLSANKVTEGLGRSTNVLPFTIYQLLNTNMVINKMTQ